MTPSSADPGGYFLRERSAVAEGATSTPTAPIYRPGHDVHLKAVLRWNERGLPSAFDRQQVEFVVVGPRREGRAATAAAGRRLRRGLHLADAARARAALGDYTITVNSEDSDASGSFEVAGVPEARVRGVGQRPAAASTSRATKATLTVRARYYFGQPVAHGRVKLVTYSLAYWSPWRYLGERQTTKTVRVPGVLRRRQESQVRGRTRRQRRGHPRPWTFRPASRTATCRSAARSARDRRHGTRGERPHDGRRHGRPLGRRGTQANRWLQAPGSTAQFRVRRGGLRREAPARGVPPCGCRSAA